MSNSPKYIVFLSTDGAGTHIMRSLIMELSERGLADPIDHSSFLPLASSCLIDPDGHKFDEERSNTDVFADLCQSMDLPFKPSNLDRETVYQLFEAAYSNSKLVLDFARPRYTTVRADLNWTQEDVDALRDLLLGYIDRPAQKIELIFYQQVRNPLDHLASLHERFSYKYSLSTLRDVIATYLDNLEIYRKELQHRSYQKYLSTRLDNVVADFDGFYSEFSKLTGITVKLSYYTSKLSLNKWLSCQYVYKFLDDPEFMQIAKNYGYSYPRLPPGLRWAYRVWGAFRRNCLELKVIIDTALGKININNPINTKHQTKGLIPRIVNRLLSMLGINCPSKHRNIFHHNLIKHNKK